MLSGRYFSENVKYYKFNKIMKNNGVTLSLGVSTKKHLVCQILCMKVKKVFIFMMEMRTCLMNDGK